MTFFSVSEILILSAFSIRETWSIKWSWGAENLEFPHDPSLLDNGNILLFDNGLLRGYSRVLELEPASQEIVWEYTGSPPEDFYSPIMGAAQRLPNGNTFITHSWKGRLFEVTSSGDIVWDFYNPHIFKGTHRRATIYKARRFADIPGTTTLSE